MFCDDKVPVVFTVNYKLTHDVFVVQKSVQVLKRDQIQERFMCQSIARLHRPVSTQTIILLIFLPFLM